MSKMTDVTVRVYQFYAYNDIISNENKDNQNNNYEMSAWIWNLMRSYKN